MGTMSKLSRVCSFLMAFLFAYSASVQLNDPDWYLWFPLYSLACLVNLIDNTSLKSKVVRVMGRASLWLGLFLYIRVVVEDYRHGIAGFWSVDLRERVVREKIGSGLVVSSMMLQLVASKPVRKKPSDPAAGNTALVDVGMVALVGMSYGLSFIFFAYHKDEMKT
ncbi:hypothetical protein MLD38_025882 [Melastoma candidum]|uniref:Uncharacterized protein n=1 Tax=Melastoma candidum TaxID=119954 RepID=A0ACB9NYD8_9MYRT|nr:hypothetical protein MLD38_025882 [Melastoma candidum]